MLKRHSDIYASCPWCGKSETFADNRADIRVSCCCSYCRKYYKIDFKTMTVIRIKANSHRIYRK
jgi:hypothetical protein